MTLTVATGQFASQGDVEADIATVVRAVELARGADLLVLPELFLGGYRMPPIVVGETDPRLRPIETAAAEAAMVVLVGACLDGPDGFTISTLAFGLGDDPAGRRVYDKQNPCDAENEHVVPGVDSVIIDVRGWSVGLSICYDGCFPEHARAVALAGAEVYAASVAYFTGSAHRRELYYRARALENGMYAVVSGLTGSVAGADFDGGSAVYDPEGRVVAEVGTGEGVAVATLDRPLLKATRAQHAMLADLREPGPVVRR
ncbi:carbon-nitrogen hydrolase family protein [Aeromicrobium sp. 636]|uniref:Carbon-nitrogen hydrolase family protein n=1 Tax=Aeromicrobium senzhongii TaxID=2663859 RepID=A0A8I0EYB2_9ACTN|nr:carbon-nitrogen hydrolase family protein [Aeromicrobium sp. 636]MBC9227540.1 carbon-nitrogen hydrolase family protein [Aeromicrobium senzhongii]MCQ3999637.1 carbon-nitrogen hydrolase family protein [Aeromicrobium sp. 636]